MNAERRLDGFWRWGSSERRPGVLVLSDTGGPVLHLSGSFADFRSYESPARGARSNRNLIRGTTADGMRYTLVDCVETSSRTHFGGQRRRHVEKAYSASWYLVGGHFAAYSDLCFRAISFDCDFLNELIGESFFLPKHFKGGRGFRLSYRRPRTLALRVGQYTIRFSQNVPVSFSSRVQAVERGLVTIECQTPQPFDDFWHGPVTAVRSLLAFVAETKPQLLHVTAGRDRRGRMTYELGGLGLSRRPKRFHRAGKDDCLFTLRSLKPSTRGRVVRGWFALLKDQKLLPVWALYSAASLEAELFTETRFLMLAQALETYHRATSTETRIPVRDHDERRRRVLSGLEQRDRDWVTEAIARSNELTLRLRLQAIYDEVPEPLVHHLPDRRRFVARITKTRNFLTHFDSTGAQERLQGFELMEATGNMRVVLQYLLLQSVGFSLDEAATMAHTTMVRDLYRARGVKGMLPT